MANERFFSGTYSSTMDEKSRLVMPAVLREELGRDFMVTLSVNNPCLWVVPREDFVPWARRIKDTILLANRELEWAFRLFSNLAYPGTLDDQGRLFISPELRGRAHLSTGAKKICIAGFVDRIEIWDASTYQDLCSGVTLSKLVTKFDEITKREHKESEG